MADTDRCHNCDKPECPARPGMRTYCAGQQVDWRARALAERTARQEAERERDEARGELAAMIHAYREAQATSLDAATRTIERLREALTKLRRDHVTEENDVGMCSSVMPAGVPNCGACDCGTDAHNALIDAALKEGSK